MLHSTGKGGEDVLFESREPISKYWAYLAAKGSTKLDSWSKNYKIKSIFPQLLTSCGDFQGSVTANREMLSQCCWSPNQLKDSGVIILDLFLEFKNTEAVYKGFALQTCLLLFLTAPALAPCLTPQASSANLEGSLNHLTRTTALALAATRPRHSALYVPTPLQELLGQPLLLREPRDSHD